MRIFYHVPVWRPEAGDLKNFLPDAVECFVGNDGLEEHCRLARNGEARVLVECPDAALPGIEMGAFEHAENLKVRVVAPGDGIPGLAPLTILLMHNFAFRKVTAPTGRVLLTAAKVAGYRSATFGLPDECFPLLFFHPQSENILIAGAAFGNFIRGRFAPRRDWEQVVAFLAGFLTGGARSAEVNFAPSVAPAYAAGAPLPVDAETVAFRRCLDWFYRETIYSLHGQYGVLEGFSSVIDSFGNQSAMPAMRGDCMGETVLATAVDAAISKNPDAVEISARLLRTLFESGRISDLSPASQTYGSLWFYENLPIVYGDDNSRAGFGAVLAGELLGMDRSIPAVLKMAYSLLRTTGPTGLRRPNLSQPKDFTDGRTWQYYFKEKYTECRPHYQAFHWAFNLQMYVLTGDSDFLNSAKAAMTIAAAQFPDYLWQNGATPDWARLILPFAMLVEVEDTPEHRAQLARICDHFINLVNEHGVVPELMGDRAKGRYPAPSSNADYGKCEAALVQHNGDPVCDLLYTLNYAFIGLHEAFMATGDGRCRQAGDRLAEFLCRVQAKSAAHAALDGCWLRGFDFELWEYFGNASDSGWGPWCVETGWTNAWIALTLGLRKLNRPLLARSQRALYQAQAPEIKRAMFEHVFSSTTKKGTFTEVDMSIKPNYIED